MEEAFNVIGDVITISVDFITSMLNVRNWDFGSVAITSIIVMLVVVAIIKFIKG